jgi:hypothetical protein
MPPSSLVIQEQLTPRGVRLVQGDCVLSEVLKKPGATHSIFDVLGALVARFSPGPSACVLGFAGGGMVAPMRALGATGVLDAVDLAPEGYALFSRVARAYRGEVRFHTDDAVAWLEGTRGGWHAIVEDLSVPDGGEVTKPAVSLEVLPALAATKLSEDGLYVSNVLPVPGLSWRDALSLVRAPFARAVEVRFTEFENRIVVASANLSGAAVLSGRLRAALDELGSSLARGVRLRAL